MVNDSNDKPRYSRKIAAQIANISLEFLERCEVENLVETGMIRDGETGYSIQEVRKLVLIHSLNEVLEINMRDMDVVLHLHDQILELQHHIDELERRKIEREEQLLNELAKLRRFLADDAAWD